MTDERHIIHHLAEQFGYLFITRDSTVFEKQIIFLEKLMTEITAVKAKYAEQQNEMEANKWLGIENLCHAITYGHRMFLDLKKNDPDNAWLHLISAQNHAHWSAMEYELGGTIQKAFILHFANIEKVLFPSQMFNSVELVVKSSECSICHKEFAKCEHIRGEAYMGEFCSEIASESEIVSSSIVSNPADKGCRITHTGNTNIMTLMEDPSNHTESRKK